MLEDSRDEQLDLGIDVANLGHLRGNMMQSEQVFLGSQHLEVK